MTATLVNLIQATTQVLSLHCRQDASQHKSGKLEMVYLKLKLLLWVRETCQHG